MNFPIKEIAFLTHPYHRGGVTKWMAEAAKECARQDIRVYFVTVNPLRTFVSGKNRLKMVNMIGNAPNFFIIAPSVNFTFEFGTSEYKTFKYSQAILKNVPAGVPIIVSDDPSVWAAAAALSGRNPMIGVIHSSRDAVYFAMAKKFSQNLACAICVSNRTKEALKNFLGKVTMPVFVIPCGINLHTPLQKNEEVNNEDKLKLLWVGRLDESSKRISDLPKLAIKLKDAGYNFQIDIIGNGDSENLLREQIQKNNLFGHILLHGWMETEDIYKSLIKSDLFILTSNYEGMPVAVMEALSAGVGVVASRVSGLEDLEGRPETKDCLWLYPVGDLDKAIVCIENAQKIPKPTIAKNALRLASSEFSIEVCVQRYLSAFREISFMIKKEDPDIHLSGIKIFNSNIRAALRTLKLKITKSFS